MEYTVPQFDVIPTSIEVYVADLTGVVETRYLAWLIDPGTKFGINHISLRIPREQAVKKRKVDEKKKKTMKPITPHTPKKAFDYCVIIDYITEKGITVSIKVFQNTLQISSGVKDITLIREAVMELFPLLNQAQWCYEQVMMLPSSSEEIPPELTNYIERINWTKEPLPKKIDWIRSLPPPIVPDRSGVLGLGSVLLSMSNCIYNLGGSIDLLMLALNIRKCKGFENAYINYNNLLSPSKMIIYIDVELDAEMKKLIKKKKKPYISFQIYSSGPVTQSGPMRSCNEQPYYQLRAAIEQLRSIVFRTKGIVQKTKAKAPHQPLIPHPFDQLIDE